MQICSTIVELREVLARWRRESQAIAVVPTMGNLHAGHLDLVRRARELAPRVVATIFVNPMQFGANEDFGGYPRTLEADLAKLREQGTDLVFTPAVTELYPDGLEHAAVVDVPALGAELCGAVRPGHFRGVTTVVSMLFNMVQPDVAVFGRKDYQQVLVIERMVRDLHFPVFIEAVDTVREEDGLAMSSRNMYLSADDRRAAPAIYRSLCSTRDALLGGERDFAKLEADGVEHLSDAGIEPDYFSVRRASDLHPASSEDTDFVILAAGRLGKARLIDNVLARTGR